MSATASGDRVAVPTPSGNTRVGEVVAVEHAPSWGVDGYTYLSVDVDGVRLRVPERETHAPDDD